MNRLPFDLYDFFGYLASGFLVLLGMQLLFGFPQVLGQDFRPVDTTALLLAIYVAGHIVAGPAKTLLEDGLVAKVLRRPSVNLFHAQKPRLRSILFPGFYQQLPPSVQRKVLTKAKRADINAPGEQLFLHARYHPNTLANEKLMAKLHSFLSQYGFARNMAFTSLLLGFALLLKSRIPVGAAEPDVVSYAWTAMVVGILLLYRYLKFFRQYSYELFNVFAEMPEDDRP
ncbi:MAG: hypothetical protein OXG72_07550 [Acidobacteria bacterium]|nr:hypothetical protein [Acidobacteriota bacterium]